MKVNFITEHYANQYRIGEHAHSIEIKHIPEASITFTEFELRPTLKIADVTEIRMTLTGDYHIISKDSVIVLPKHTVLSITVK